MRLADFYLADPRLVLVPIEHLGPTGMRREMAALLAAERGWTPARVALFDRAFALYWTRSTALARRTRTWLAPRLRHVAVVTEPLAVRPYAQLLNTSAWTLYASDFDPDQSHPEFAAYLLVHGDRMAFSGVVATAGVHTAAWWFERTEEERAAFTSAAARSARPDAAAFQAIAAALAWLPQLRHENLCPPHIVSPHRSVPGTGLLVPRALEAGPPALMTACAAAAEHTLTAYRRKWRKRGGTSVAALCEWLAGARPPLVVTDRTERIVWDPEQPDRLGTLRRELVEADDVAVDAVAADLRVIERHTRAFLAAVVDPAALPTPPAYLEHGGYSFLHRERRLIGYNLHEPGMERLHGPPLPYARAMLGARTAHEWGHLAATAGWVPRHASADEFSALRVALAARLDGVIEAAPPAVRAGTAADLASLGGSTPGTALARLLLKRVPDYQSNLVARHFTSEEERETYVRQNVRMLRSVYRPGELWRMLIRYLFEYQYLGFSAVPDPRAYLFSSTWFADDFVATAVLDERRFDDLATAVAQLCACWAVDETRLRIA